MSNGLQAECYVGRVFHGYAGYEMMVKRFDRRFSQDSLTPAGMNPEDEMTANADPPISGVRGDLAAPGLSCAVC